MTCDRHSENHRNPYWLFPKVSAVKECNSAATPTPYPAKLLEGLSVDDSGEMLDNDTEALLLQLCGQTPHLLGPLDFWKTANQLLSATEHGYSVLHSLNGDIYQLKKLSLREDTKQSRLNAILYKSTLLFLPRTCWSVEGLPELCNGSWPALKSQYLPRVNNTTFVLPYSQNAHHLLCSDERQTHDTIINYKAGSLPICLHPHHIPKLVRL